jgi:acyl dehydratase
VTRWFENVILDESFELGSHRFEEADMVAFAQAYDPEYFHIDPQAARHSHWGGLVASGWQVASVGHRLMVERLFAEEASLRARGEEPGVSGPSPGGSKLEFKAPVRPDDVVSYRLSVYDKRASNSIAGWGLLFNRMIGTNQKGEEVYFSEFVGFSKLRDYRPSGRARVLQRLIQLPVIGPWLKRRA